MEETVTRHFCDALQKGKKAMNLVAEKCERWLYDVCLCGCIRSQHILLVDGPYGPCGRCMKHHKDRLPTGELWSYACNGFVHSNYNKYFETVSYISLFNDGRKK